RDRLRRRATHERDDEPEEGGDNTAGDGHEERDLHEGDEHVRERGPDVFPIPERVVNHAAAPFMWGTTVDFFFALPRPSVATARFSSRPISDDRMYARMK